MELTAAALAGAMARFVCHPMDTVKTVSFTGFAASNGPTLTASSSPSSFRTNKASAPPAITTARAGDFLPQPPQQQHHHHQHHQPPPKLGSVFHSARQIWKAEGIRGFYRGVGVTVIGSAPGVGLYLSVYRWSNESLQHRWMPLQEGTKERSSGQPNAGRGAMGHWISFVSGLIAEAVSCLVWVPVDVSKERLQSQPPALVGRYAGSWDALQTIIRLEGWRGLYKGYWSTLGSFGPYSGTYFVFYEYFSSVLPTTTVSAFWRPLLAGIGATAVASICTNPLELLKTRLQVQRTVLSTQGGKGSASHLFRYQYKGLWDGIGQVVRTEGCLALWKGTTARIAYQAPNAALTMTLFEFLLRRWGGNAKV